MKPILIRFTILFATLMLAACASTPVGSPPEIVRLDNELHRLRADPTVAPYAVDELDKAESAVHLLDERGRRLDEPMFRHGIYLADRLVQIAESTGHARHAEQRAKELGVERDRLLVDLRTREADSARQLADVALNAASNERRNAQAARNDADAARDQLEAVRLQLTELQTRQTERGLVVTLGDVLFEVDRAALKPGATRALDQLANALRSDADARVTIEGHTDSTGSREHNMDLSARRVDAVHAYLVTHGVDPSKISGRGLGPDYPVASNGTEAGRQQNRRVEVIVNSSVVR